MTPWIAVGTHTRSEIYHTDPECVYLERIQTTREVSQQHVEKQDRRICKLCSDAEDHKGKNDTEWHEINAELKDPETTL